MQLKSDSKPPVVRVVAGLIVDSNGRGLVAKRSQQMSSPGLWEIPGGKIEPGESARDALKRELQEELSVSVSVCESFATAEVLISDRRYTMEAYVCKLIEGECRATEHEVLRWIIADDVFRLSWAPLDVPMLSELSKLLRESG